MHFDYQPADQGTSEEVSVAIAMLSHSGKPVKVAAVLTELPLHKIVENHFRFRSNSPYLWEATPRMTQYGSVYMGVWLTDKINYIHVVFATEEVLEYILSLKRDLERD